jgi:hypothetical protein
MTLLEHLEETSTEHLNFAEHEHEHRSRSSFLMIMYFLTVIYIFSLEIGAKLVTESFFFGPPL